jgi:hypothetical protein
MRWTRVLVPSDLPFLFCLLLTSGLPVRAQGVPSDLGFDTKTLNTLSTALVKDLSHGDIEWARIHIMQLTAVYSGALVSSQSAGARSKLARFLNMRPPGVLPADPSATVSLVPIAEELQSAVENDDLDLISKEARRLAGEIAKLNSRLSKEHLRRSVENIPDPAERSYMTLTLQLSDALRADDIATAESLAPGLLEQTESLKSSVSSAAVGENIYNAYDALGRAAFNRGDYDAAKRDLLLAGTTPGGGVLSSFGPDLKLAQELLDKGESDTVVDFLTACKSFWKKPIIDQWIADIKAGQRPTLAFNVRHPSYIPQTMR